MNRFLSIHTEDRDVSKWPNTNHFSVVLPVEYKNVACIKLEDIQLPFTHYVFTTAYGNTTFLVGTTTPTTTVTIAEGTYTPYELATELANKITAAMENQDVIVEYNAIQYKYIFTSSSAFSLSFETSNINHSNWGLGSHLGFKKQSYTSVLKTNNYDLPLGDSAEALYRIMSESPCFIYGHSTVYMEIDQYNTMDEIEPYTYKSNLLVHSRHSGKHNSCFAKISALPKSIEDVSQTGISSEGFIHNPFRSDPPLERVQKLIFKFRYHDGRLIDFGNVDFNFTLSFLLVHECMRK
jgi:hypothetical protein